MTTSDRLTQPFLFVCTLLFMATVFVPSAARAQAGAPAAGAPAAGAPVAGGAPAVGTPSAGAQASAAQGVLVRLEPGGQPVTAPPLVRMTPTEGGDVIELTLKDDGQSPDVEAADGRWAGVALTLAKSFTVTVDVGGETLDAGAVEWEPGVGARDLVLTLMWGGVTAMATSPASQGTAGAPAPSGGAGVAASASGAAPAELVASGSDGLLWVALGLGALSLVGGLVLVLRGGRGPSNEIKLDRAPEPPVFGGGTPALHAELSVWQVADADRDAFLAGLVGALARHHRVMLVLPGHVAVPAVFGGPVYFCRETDARKIEDHLIDIVEQPGLPLVPVFVADAPDDDQVLAFADMLDPDLGGILLTARPPAARPPHVTVALTQGGATLTTQSGEIELLVGRLGYAPVA